MLVLPCCLSHQNSALFSDRFTWTFTVSAVLSASLYPTIHRAGFSARSPSLFLVLFSVIVLPSLFLALFFVLVLPYSDHFYAAFLSALLRARLDSRCPHYCT